MFAESKEFRSAVYFRLKRRYRLLPQIFLKGQDSCHICSEKIGNGLLLIHGYSTTINAYRFGTGKGPTDEMLAQVMREVAQDAKKSNEEAAKKYLEDMRREMKKMKLNGLTA